MNAIDKLALKAELVDSVCELNHCGEPPPQAVDFIIQPWGYKESENVEVAKGYLTIPICKDCQETLNDNKWVIFICQECLASHWCCRKYANKVYGDDPIIWMPAGCPECDE